MKKIISIAVAVLMCAVFALTSCTTPYDKAPNEYKKVRWETPDYSFVFYPEDDCKGKYIFNDKTYELKIEFETATLTAFDTAHKNKQLFTADWRYEDEKLVIYDIVYNTKDYKEFKTNYNSIYTLKTAKLENKK